MKRILIRSGKSPLRVASPAEFIHQDLIGTNTGNLLFSDSAHKMLTTPNTEVTSNGIRTNHSAERAAEINEQYDVFVVPLANAFRPQFQGALDRLSTLIEQLTIPVVVFGVGAQATDDYATDMLKPMEASVKRFTRAVLDRSASIGVRGELTARYLRDHGVPDDNIDIMGCPSMFLYGDTFPAIRETQITADSRIAINMSPNARPVGPISAIADHGRAHYPNFTYYAQNTVDAELLLWGDTTPESGATDPFPKRLTHALLRENKVRMPLDPATWIDELRGYDFAYGTRIHGNIAALLAGTPAVVLTHDSRTLELCRYFDIPHRQLSTLSADTDPRDLYEAADWSAMISGHGERFERITAFLTRNGLENTYQHGDGGAAYDAQVAALDLPPSMQVWDGTEDGQNRYRMARLRERITVSETKLTAATKKNDALKTKLTATEKQLDTALKQLEATRKQLAAIERRLSGVEKRLLVRLGPALRRRSRKFSGSGDTKG
ncbi:polysaccharide pyruvyl transferase family protein [Streptomyces sp. TRM68416]|uniref:polysaccharide pyruvyl transferase family protein n=1 Tax=Streptomyces sp. TRM68416 TaxID=2758412 RepID=UPI001661D30C|nr:polysaccharide pyruvyl transferase family protein [Streptomyces sp. TRM68416]MBD0841184.1 polysaccharide pyruvyl transferase family protein [Streptomyces sp. TRM68416]